MAAAPNEFCSHLLWNIRKYASHQPYLQQHITADQSEKMTMELVNNQTQRIISSSGWIHALYQSHMTYSTVSNRVEVLGYDMWENYQFAPNVLEYSVSEYYVLDVRKT